MHKYRDEDIRKVTENCDIETIVGYYITLQKKGASLLGLCPFHNDTTPSLHVSIAKQIFKCFSCGEGGTAISFIMKYEHCDYITAVEKAAEICHIEITPVELSDEEAKKEKKREEIFIAMEVAMKYFCDSIKANNPNAEKARNYVHGRWQEEFCMEYNIGFSPYDWQGLVNYAKEKGYTLAVFEAAGLIGKNKKGGYYDIFRGRMMIPVFNEFGRVISFTARIINGIIDDKGKEIIYDKKKGDRKYLNTKDTDIFHKSTSPFGINIAKNVASKEDMMYGVEGAPDALRLHSIGVLNTIATLGSNWTDQGLKKIKRYTNNFCIIPDSDLTKDEQKFSAGFKGAMESGKRALGLGLNVFIKQIPVGDDKNDADDYISSIEIFNSLKQEDFVTWYANTMLSVTTTVIEKSNAIKEVAEVVNKIPNAVTKESFKEILSAREKDGNLWMAAFGESQQVQVKTPQVTKQYSNSEMLAKFNFCIKNNCYITNDDKGNEIICSNFIIIPVLFIKGEGGSRLFKLINNNNDEALVEMSSEDLVNITKFKAKMEREGNYLWFTGSAALNCVKGYIYEVEVHACKITQLGWQSSGFFAFGNGAYCDDKWVPADELGIVDLQDKGKFYLPAFSKMHCNEIAPTAFERRFVYAEGKSITLREYTSKIIQVFGNNGKVGICYMIAAHFRDVVTKILLGFPILNVFGPKGSGKTELAHSLVAFDITESHSPNISNATLASLVGVVGQCKNALVHLDEFKNSIPENKRELIKGFWDGVGRSRANKDTFKTETTSVECGVIITGQEMSTTDPAMMNRFVHLSVPRSEFSLEEKKNFKELCEIRRGGCTHLLPEIIKYRKVFEEKYQENFELTNDEVMDRLKGYEIEDRTANNWIKVLASYRTVANMVDIPMEYNDLLNIFVEGIVVQNDKTKSNSEIGKFWKFVKTLLQDGQLYNKGDYHIKMRATLPCRILEEDKYKKETVRFDPPKKILFVRMERIMLYYSKHAKQVEEMIPAESLMYYLEHSPGYIGKAQMKFYIFRQGAPVVVSVKTKNGTTTKNQTKNETALCFDYEVLKNKYDMDLEITTADIAEEDSDTDC